jgi:hypothetical protein
MMLDELFILCFAFRCLSHLLENPPTEAKYWRPGEAVTLLYRFLLLISTVGMTTP